jgi:hypothetical protein
MIAVIGVATLVVVLCGLGAAMSGLFDFASGSGDAETAATGGPAAGGDVPAPRTSFTDGQWIVGNDIEAGTYSVKVTAGSSGCAWERNANTDGTATSVLESGSGGEGQALVVIIRSTDKVFQSKNCGTWSRTGD